MAQAASSPRSPATATGLPIATGPADSVADDQPIANVAARTSSNQDVSIASSPMALAHGEQGASSAHAPHAERFEPLLATRQLGASAPPGEKRGKANR